MTAKVRHPHHRSAYYTNPSKFADGEAIHEANIYNVKDAISYGDKIREICNTKRILTSIPKPSYEIIKFDERELKNAYRL